MPIPRGTRQLIALREVASRLGTSNETVRHWWKKGRLLGRHTEGKTRKRVAVPVEVVEFYLRYFRLPTKLDLYEAGALSRVFLLELSGPDGGLAELELRERDEATGAVAGAGRPAGGTLSVVPAS